MFYTHLRRGALAGGIGGLAFGAYTAAVVNPLVALAETFEPGHASAGHASGGEATMALTSIAGGAVWGLLLGVAVFGLAYFFLEPAIPGPDGAESYVLGAAGFLVVSAAPWLVLPPQPPGVESALSTDARLQVYVGMMVAGAIACGLAGAAFRRLRDRGLPVALVGGLLPLIGLVILSGVAPANATTAAAPEPLVTAFRGVAVVGQLGLWAILATVHARLVGRLDSTAEVDLDELAPA